MIIVLFIAVVIAAGALTYYAGVIFFHLFISSFCEGPEPHTWYKFSRAVLVGAAMAYTGAFFYDITATDTLILMAGAFNKALPFLIAVIAVAAAVVILDWWLHNTGKQRERSLEEASEIVTEARREAGDIMGKASMDAQEKRKTAEEEAWKIKQEALIIRNKAEEEMKRVEDLEILLQEEYEILRQDLEDEYQKKLDELTRKTQAYLDEINGLRRKNKGLAEELKKTREAGIQKMREQGNIGGAAREEKRLEKVLTELTV
jgi:hypothetical protein